MQNNALFVITTFLHYFVNFIFKEFEKSLTQSNLLKIIKVNENLVEKGENRKLYSYCLNFLKSFIPGYVVVSEVLLQVS